MTLVWKLLRQHISVPQFAGFAFANLFGMLIVLMGWQFYRDVLPVFTSQDSFMKADYLIVNKRIGAASSFSASANLFTASEIDDMAAQPFVKRVGWFTSANYRASANMGVGGQSVLNSELFFESVPDEFVDVPLAEWGYEVGSREVPVILPRTYINMYNFGFAQSRSLPKISDGLVGMIDFNIFIHTAAGREEFKGRVIGFSNRLNTILVPQAFMDWSNATYAPQTAEAASSASIASSTSTASSTSIASNTSTVSSSLPTRLIVEVSNPTDDGIATYLEDKCYDVDDDKLQSEKTTYFLRMTVTLVMTVGAVISLLSFYILMLSIYLLVQKNASKLENLLLIGYSPLHVAMPYGLLTIVLNAVVLALALVIVAFVRGYYMDVIEALFPQIEFGSMMPSVMLGAVLFVFISVFNYMAIHRKVMRIWWRKD